MILYEQSARRVKPRYEDFKVERMNPTESEESAESAELFLLIWPAGSDLFLFSSSVSDL